MFDGSNWGVGGRLAPPFAGVSGAVVPAVAAAAGEGVALIAVPVAEALAADGEAPVSRQTAVAPPTVRPGNANALACQLVAEGVQGTLRVAVACCK